jgi:NO-binding membrane sensor protein with MHYT domain
MNGTYDPALVALSLLVAILASYAALSLAGRVRESRDGATLGWIVGGALAMGAGIWTMHFIGMLAFSLPIRMAFEFRLTAVSMAYAVIASAIALAITSRPQLRPHYLIGGGLVMGAGICAMHYTGMAAMRMSPPIRYDTALFLASFAIAVAASVAALWLAFTLRSRAEGMVAKRLLASGFMGIAIAGMHYTGMSAAQFSPGAMCLAGGAYVLQGDSLAFVIAGVVIGLLVLALIASTVDARLSQRRAVMIARLEKSNQELQQQIEARERAQAALRESLGEQQRLTEVLQSRSAELERSNRELEQFAYVASHDLQAPLRTVNGFVQLLERKLPQAEGEVREYLSFISDASNQMRELIRALLELSRVGQDGVHATDFQLREAVDAARLALQALIEERGAVIETGELPLVHADRPLLTQLLQNLINNAIKFQPQSRPLVRIGASSESGEWVVSVQDEGIGIEEMHQKRIFQIFQRLHGPERFEGNGIGLAICEKIVHLHGGRIWVSSAAGKGATFSFSLPRQEAGKPASPA